VKELNVTLRALRYLETHGMPEGREPSLDDVAHLIGKPVDQVRKVMGYNEHVASLDGMIDRESGLSIGTASPTTPRCRRAPAAQHRDRSVGSPVALGADRAQRTVIERRYGLQGRDVATLEDIAASWASRASVCARSRRRRSKSCAAV
jgi:RNA polymerase nonessential primary-like sigma factor